MSFGTKGTSNTYQVNKDIGGNHRELYIASVSADGIDSLATTAIMIGYKQSEILKQKHFQ